MVKIFLTSIILFFVNLSSYAMDPFIRDIYVVRTGPFLQSQLWKEQKDIYWDNWIKFKNKKKSFGICEYVNHLAKKDKLVAASWFFLEGGKYGFRKTGPTVQEKEMICSGIKSLGEKTAKLEHEMFDKNIFSPTLDIIDKMKENNVNYYSYLLRKYTEIERKNILLDLHRKRMKAEEEAGKNFKEKFKKEDKKIVTEIPDHMYKGIVFTSIEKSLHCEDLNQSIIINIVNSAINKKTKNKAVKKVSFE